jgi:two-component system NtrC family response regulator
MEQAVIAAGPEPILFPRHLPAAIRVESTCSALKNGRNQDNESTPDPSVIAYAVIPPLHEFRESIYNEAERKYLVNLMAQSGHDISEACRTSGLSQSRLYALLKKQNLSSH